MKIPKENQEMINEKKEMFTENQASNMEEDSDEDYCNICSKRVDRCQCFEKGVERMYFRR